MYTSPEIAISLSENNQIPHFQIKQQHVLNSFEEIGWPEFSEPEELKLDKVYQVEM